MESRIRNSEYNCVTRTGRPGYVIKKFVSFFKAVPNTIPVNNI